MSNKTSFNEKKICEEYLTGESTVTLAKKHQTTYQTIRNVLIRNGIKLRNHREKTLNAIKQGRKPVSALQKKIASERWQGEGNPNWKPIGTIKYDSQGYAIMKTENGWLEKARVVAEKQLGRKLRKEEIIHHINGIKNDDRPENLYLFKNGKEHRQYHMADNLLKGIKMKKKLKSNIIV